MSIADQFIRNGTIKTALVVGAETLSTIVDWKDRSTCVLFGDGAGAAILRATDSPAHSIISTQLYSDGTQGELLCIPHGGSRVPPSSPDFRFDMAKVRMKGSEVFKFAVRNMIDATHSILEKNNLTSKDVDFFILHQANIRIVDFCLKNLGVDESKTWMNLHKYGNTSAATLPVCLDEAWKAGKVKPGQLILMATFGGGLTWGSSLIRL
jgi:3-oxoacyl-[acyl-carrier-protein] synthase-3